MHGAELPADHRGQGVIVLDIVAARFGGGLAARRGVKGAVDLIEGPGPGIALVAHESLRDGQRMALPVGPDAADLAQKRRRIGKIVRREIAAHLGLGMLASRDVAEDLQHHRVVDDQRAVRLLGRQPHDGRVGRPAQDLDLVGRRLEDDLAFRRVDALGVGERGQHLARKDRQRKGVG